MRTDPAGELSKIEGAFLQCDLDYVSTCPTVRLRAPAMNNLKRAVTNTNVPSYDLGLAR
jgi:hypothetical protein